MPSIDTVDSLTICASAPLLFDTILDYPRLVEWYPRYRVSVIGGGPIEEGTRLQHELSPKGSPLKSRFTRTIRRLTRPQAIAETYDDGDLVGSGLWEFEELGTTETRVSFHCKVRSNRLWMHLGFALAGERGHKMVYQELLAALRDRCEGSGASQ